MHVFATKGADHRSRVVQTRYEHRACKSILHRSQFMVKSLLLVKQNTPTRVYDNTLYARCLAKRSGVQHMLVPRKHARPLVWRKQNVQRTVCNTGVNNAFYTSVALSNHEWFGIRCCIPLTLCPLPCRKCSTKLRRRSTTRMREWYVNMNILSQRPWG